VVTGAGSGIGRATALAFANEGARLALLDVSSAGLDETVRLAGDTDHLALECDVSNPSAIASAFSQIDTVIGPINVLVNNAGINPPVDSSLDVDEAYFDRIMDVNSKGIFFCAQAAMRSMIPQRSGAIVNLGSVSGMIGWGGSSVYSASKGAVLALTKALAIELAPFSIRVNAVAPGSVRTPMVQNNVNLGENPDNAWERIAAMHPLGRPGEPEDIADAITFLASARSSFVTGSVLTIDGGLTAQ
jgi:NAD(P)-dependent dehydrogenase (short-subunit alcohol dehydrogenase family)